MCKRIGPTVEEAGKQAGKLVKLDFSNAETAAKAQETAKSLNMNKAWGAEKGQGFVVIFNKNRPDDYRKLAGSTDIAAYVKLMEEVK